MGSLRIARHTRYSTLLLKHVPRFAFNRADLGILCRHQVARFTACTICLSSQDCVLRTQYIASSLNESCKRETTEDRGSKGTNDLRPALTRVPGATRESQPALTRRHQQIAQHTSIRLHLAHVEADDDLLTGYPKLSPKLSAQR